LIPVEGRVVAIADVFDAFTNDRVYRSAFSEPDAEEMMRQQRSQQFDPELLDIFLAHLDEIVAIRRSDPDSIEVNEEGPA
jgi:putative two-component system response regulator